MQTRIRQMMLAVSLALVAIMAGALPVAAQSSHYSLRMQNNTGLDIYQVHLSSAADPSWRRDLLGSGILEDGSSFTVNQISPGRYDLLIVDGEGASCSVRNFPIFSDRNFNLTLGWLVDNCE